MEFVQLVFCTNCLFIYLFVCLFVYSFVCLFFPFAKKLPKTKLLLFLCFVLCSFWRCSLERDDETRRDETREEKRRTLETREKGRREERERERQSDRQTEMGCKQGLQVLEGFRPEQDVVVVSIVQIWMLQQQQDAEDKGSSELGFLINNKPLCSKTLHVQTETERERDGERERRRETERVCVCVGRGADNIRSS